MPIDDFISLGGDFSRRLAMGSEVYYQEYFKKEAIEQTAQAIFNQISYVVTKEILFLVTIPIIVFGAVTVIQRNFYHTNSDKQLIIHTSPLDDWNQFIQKMIVKTPQGIKDENTPFVEYDDEVTTPNRNLISLYRTFFSKPKKIESTEKQPLLSITYSPSKENEAIEKIEVYFPSKPRPKNRQLHEETLRMIELALSFPCGSLKKYDLLDQYRKQLQRSLVDSSEVCLLSVEKAWKAYEEALNAEELKKVEELTTKPKQEPLRFIESAPILEEKKEEKIDEKLTQLNAEYTFLQKLSEEYVHNMKDIDLKKTINDLSTKEFDKLMNQYRLLEIITRAYIEYYIEQYEYIHGEKPTAQDTAYRDLIGYTPIRDSVKKILSQFYENPIQEEQKKDREQFLKNFKEVQYEVKGDTLLISKEAADFIQSLKNYERIVWLLKLNLTTKKVKNAEEVLQGELNKIAKTIITGNAYKGFAMELRGQEKPQDLLLSQRQYEYREEDNLELEKLQTRLNIAKEIDVSRYQTVTIDKEKKQIFVSTPLLGKFYTFFAYKTKLDQEFIIMLMEDIRLGAEKMPSNRELFAQFLESIGNVKTLIQNKALHDLSNEERRSYLKELSKIEYQLLKKWSSQGAMPSLKEMMDSIAFDGKPLTGYEKAILNFYRSKLVSYNKAKIGYDLIEKNTRSLKLKDFKKMTHETATGFEYECYDLSSSHYQFLIHSTNLKNSAEFLKIFNEKDLKSPSLCASLLGPDTSFFEASRFVAFVLAVDPNNIILTSKQDVQTPAYNGSNGNKAVLEMTEDFYNFYEKVQVLVSYVDSLYQATGIDGKGSVWNDYQKFNRLSVQKEDTRNGVDEKKELEKEWSDLIQRYPNGELQQDLPEFQLTQLIKHYENVLQIEEGEFLRLFGYEGKNEGIVAELKAYLIKIKELKANDTIETDTGKKYLWRNTLNRLQGPSELLSQTKTKYSSGFMYNEINIRLDYENNRKTRPLEVKAIIIEKSLANSKLRRDVESLESLIEYANKNNLPIFLR